MDDKDSIILNLSSFDGNKKYYCSYCNTRLTPLPEKDMEGGYICTKCIIRYWPNQQPVKKANKFDLPGPDTDDRGNVTGDKTIPIATIDDPNKELSSTTYKQQKLPAAYEALCKQGFKWITYEER
jgi:hypothetical protein